MLAKNAPNPKGNVPLISGDVLYYTSKVSAPKNPRMVLSPRPPRVTPSEFMREIAMTTDERLQNTHTMKRPLILELLDMGTTTYQKFTDVPLSRAIFQPFPSEIIFQQYEPGKVHEVPLILRNDDKVPRLVKVTAEFSPYFKVIAPSNSGDKVAPGMAANYTVQFFPEENKDYAHELVCVSERERFSVPIRCIGARAVLDFPDTIDFGVCPVKFKSQKTVHVRNIGSKPAKFEFDSEDPFSVTPLNGVLEVGENMQAEIEFFPQKLSDYSCSLRIAFETGESLFVSLFGTAVDTNVRLGKNTVLMEKTFISMATQQVVNIVNNSDYHVHFKWKKLPSHEIESDIKQRMLIDLEDEEATEKDRFLEECQVEPQIKDRMSILYRSFYNRKQTVKQDDVLFDDEHFTIEPLEGDIFPHCELPVNISFKPLTVNNYTSVAYCDVSGRELRMPLRLKGEAIGPKVSLSYTELNVGNVYINSVHIFEIVLANKGSIDAIYSILPNNTPHGSCFSFDPRESLLCPDSHQAITIRFEALTFGIFAEHFLFTIDGTSEPLTLRVIGNTIGPSLSFDVPVLKFGSVSYGFPSTMKVELKSDSVIPFEFILNVPSDGESPPHTGALDAPEDSDQTVARSGPPKEFTIEPRRGIIEAGKKVEILVTLTSNTLQKYDTTLVVDVVDAGSDIVHLPIKARCVVPTILANPQVVDFNRCFLRHPFVNDVTLVNETDLMTRYELVAQNSGDDLPFNYYSETPKGIIHPRSSIKIPLTVVVNHSGQHDFPVQFMLFGSRDPPVMVSVRAFGEGPVVHASEYSLDYGLTPVLNNVHKRVTLSNESLIPAQFSTRFHHAPSVWHTDPEIGSIPPGHSLQLRVIAFLDDSVRFKDRLFIDIADSPSLCVELSAEGHGSTIVSDPPISPVLDLQSRFCNRRFQYELTLTNMGRRQQQIFWSTEGFERERISTQRKASDLTEDIRDLAVKKKRAAAAAEANFPHFTLTPNRAALMPGESVDVVLEGFSHTAKQVKERLICHTIYNKNTGKQKIITSDVIAEFVEPLIEFRSRQVSFRQDVNPGEETREMTEVVPINNVSELPLTAVVSVDPPFSLVDEASQSEVNQLERKIEPRESFDAVVKFNANNIQDRHSQHISANLRFSYKEHPQEETIRLEGDVNFPNLNFSYTHVNFGCILNHTEATQFMEVSNPSPLPVSYCWQFEPPEHPIVLEASAYVPPESAPPSRQLLSEPAAEKSQVDELQSEKSGMNEGRSRVGRSLEDREQTPGVIGGHQSALTDEDGTGSKATTANSEQGSYRDLQPSGYQGHVDTMDSQITLAGTAKEFKSAAESEPIYAGIEEVFDILPLYGVVNPGESQRFAFSFYGHPGISVEGKAVCRVDGGPDYTIDLTGSASVIRYHLDTDPINFGKQMFDQVCSSSLTLKNTGSVGCEFACLDSELVVSQDDLKPGVPLVIPASGFLEANEEVELQVFLIPGAPEKFEKSVRIQVAHFEPHVVRVSGEGVFPRLVLDLPRAPHPDWEAETSQIVQRIRRNRGLAAQDKPSLSLLSIGQNAGDDEEYEPTTLEVEMEMEVEIVRKFFAANPEYLQRPELRRENPVFMPDYMLDFGHVILGDVKTHVLCATNAGHFPLSFTVDESKLRGSGFAIEIQKVKNLPGAPDHESVHSVVGFDPRGAGLDVGPVEATAVIQVKDGPWCRVRLVAEVTQPSLELSQDVVDFGEVSCGQCKIVSVQLHNHSSVKCDWTFQPPPDKNKDKSDKFVPMHLRKRARPQASAPLVFEMLPRGGSLLPGERANVQLKFMPVQQQHYSQRIPIKLAQSAHRVVLSASGSGVEPALEFQPAMLQFGPILPHSAGEEKEIVVRNPTSEPIEFFSVEFDTQYLEEERVLRMMRGYDQNNTLLLPPREAGQPLPQELLDFLEKEKKKAAMEAAKASVAESEEPREEESPGPNEGDEVASRRGESAVGEAGEDEEEAEEDADADGAQTSMSDRKPDDLAAPSRSAQVESVIRFDDGRDTALAPPDSAESAGDLEVTPVSAAIARYLDIDLSAEGKKARNRRGVAVVVNGAPQSGKTSTAEAIAAHYQGKVLNIDQVVLDAIVAGSTPAGLKARELCQAAAEALQEPEATDDPETVASTVKVEEPKVEPATDSSVTVSVKDKAGKGRKPDTHQSEPPPTAPEDVFDQPRRLSVSSSVGGGGLMSCHLPEEVLVEILDDRMQMSDCYCCVVFDSLDTLFARSPVAAALAVLKAFNNRKYIFFVTLSLSLQDLKDREERAIQQKERRREERLEAERTFLREMDEDTYDALSEEQKAQVDAQQLQLKRERMARERARQEEERRKREQEALLEQQRLEEEMKAKKGKKKGGNDSASKPGEKEKKDKKRPESSMVQPKASAAKDSRRSHPEPQAEHEEEPPVAPETEEERKLKWSMSVFEGALKDVMKVAERWDRSKGALARPVTPSADDGEEGAGGGGHKLGGAYKARARKDDKPEEGSEDAAAGAAVADSTSGVPHIVLGPELEDVKYSEKVLSMEFMPALQDVMEGLGLGSQGAPIPPPSFFSVVPYPQKRSPVNTAEISQHYLFVASSPTDPNAAVSAAAEDADADEEAADDVAPTTTSRRTAPGKKSPAVAAADSKKGTSQTSKSSRKKKAKEEQEEPIVPKLIKFRWVVPANGEISLRMRFFSPHVGQFDQTLNFEITQTKRRYQLFARGICAFPQISREPRVIFPSRKKALKPDELVNKKFIMATETYEFGPLLCGKSRERYLEGRYHENMETLNIANVSQMPAEIGVTFLEDNKGETFLVHPPVLNLAPGESQTLSIWAYPKGPGVFSDTLICCIKENPEPLVFKVSCTGVRPEIELDKREFKFEKVLLHRKDSRTIFIKNTSLLPVAWRVTGLESLGEDFTMSTEQGIIEAKKEFPLVCHFRGLKPTNVKKTVKLEVSDKEQVMGLVQLENLSITAEAYDVALDMSFPKGTEGGVDFGTNRVGETVKQTISLKNKGKYECGFNFLVEREGPYKNDMDSLFVVYPAKGSLVPNDRPTTVQITFVSSYEVVIKDLPLVKCNIVDPNLGAQGEVIACIPIKVNVKALYSRYALLPQTDVDFGSVMLNAKRSQQLVIENRGEFDFKFTISKPIADDQILPGGGSGGRPGRSGASTDNVRGRSGDASGNRSGGNRSGVSKSTGRGEQQPGSHTFSGSKMMCGPFSINPAFGVVVRGAQQVVTVDCLPESIGRHEEELLIDIAERDPKDRPDGITYHLLADAVVPGFNTQDIMSIFEEHVVCKSRLAQFLNSHKLEHVQGVYSEEENRFMFNNVVVGKSAVARFKITNPYKVKCDVVFNVQNDQPVGSKKGPTEVFELETRKAVVLPHTSVFAELSFKPTSMQTFTGTFEAAVEGLPPSLSQRFPPLTFQLVGDGNLPRVSVVKPTLKNKQGHPLLLFKRLLVGQEQTLQITVTNDGTLRSTMFVDLLDESGTFGLKLVTANQSVYTDGDERPPHQYGLVLSVGEEAVLDVTFLPRDAGRSNARVQVALQDNPFEDVLVHLVGEGYMDDITLHNIHPANASLAQWLQDEEAPEVVDDSDAEFECNHLRFGSVFVGAERRLVFALQNNSASPYRFCWPADHPHLTFSPRVGHLHPGCSKDVTATFLAHEPVEIPRGTNVYLQAHMIQFSHPIDEVKDWDDRQKVVKWVDANPPKSASTVKEEVKPVKGKKGPTVEKEAEPVAAAGPRKRKVTEGRPEPEHSAVEGGQRDIPVMLSATAAYTKYRTKTSHVHFQTTLMFQTRRYDFSVSNKGKVALQFHWRIVLDDGRTVEYPAEEQPITTPRRPASALSSVLSAAAAVEQRDAPSPAYVPFSVDPSIGHIAPGGKQTFTVRFSPLDIGSYHGTLICDIPNTDPADSECPPKLEMPISGSSEMPCVHFDLPESDYLSASRRDPARRGPGGEPPGNLDPNTTVFEFNITGVGFASTKKFEVINPTKTAYNFYWTCLDPRNVKVEPAFKPLVLKGSILPGQTSQMGFTFSPSELGVTESFWRFTIPGQKINMLFLLVGTTSEPCVKFELPHLNFRQILLGEQAHQLIHIVNEEDKALTYSFDPHSIYTDGRCSMLGVMPITGVIPAKSRAPLDLFFTPTAEKEYNFNLICRIKHRIQPLYLNVKAEGFAMNAELICESSSGHLVKLTNNGKNEINLKEVEPNEQAVRSLKVVNSGKYPFHFSWEVKNGCGLVKISPEKGEAKPAARVQSTLSFVSPRKCELKNCELVLSIERGPTFSVFVVGKCVAPSLKFSTKKIEFGGAFLRRPGMQPKTQHIAITNNDKRPISVQCTYENTESVGVHFPSCLLDPGATTTATATFSPTEVRVFRETLNFTLNGLSTVPVLVTGEGCEINVEPADGQKRLNFGSVRANAAVKKQIVLVNRSRAPITFDLVMNPATPRGATLANSLSIGPGTLTLREREQAAVTVKLNAKERIPNFSEEIFMDLLGISLPVFSVCGSVIDQSVRLDTEAVPFGAVVLKGESRRRILLINDGDLGVHFKWEEGARSGPDFSIVPGAGYVAPGMELPLEVTFHPTRVSGDIRCSNLLCHIQGSGHSPPLKLTLSGVCAPCPPTGKEVVQFSCPVREQEKKVIQVSNKTASQWLLTPVVEGEFFSGPETFLVEAGQTKAYEVSYRPLRMTAGGNEKHLGSAFFALPDGNGLLHNLQGTAEPPKVADTIVRDVPSKQPHTELIPVRNWEKVPQRFKVLIEFIKPEKLDPSTSMSGLDYLDVPGLTKRDYKLNFFTHKEGNYQTKVTFENERTGEYLYFYVNLKVALPGVIETIELVTPTRHPHPHAITLHNPLPTAVSFATSCPNPDILMPPQFVVAPESNGQCLIEYLPLRTEESVTKLVLSSVELGLFTYDLVLKALPPSPESPLYYRTSLGTSQLLLARFLNFAKTKCDYTIKIEQADRAPGKEDFIVEKSTVPAAPGSSAGTEVGIEVVFEPSTLGDVRAEMRVSSAIGGDYIFQLYGTAIAPRPQGPFTVKAGQSLAIPFKNVFHSQAAFCYHVDNPAFSVRGTESLRAKKQVNLHVTFEGSPDGSKLPTTGKLNVTCPRTASGNNIVWSYYIKGQP